MFTVNIPSLSHPSSASLPMPSDMLPFLLLSAQTIMGGCMREVRFTFCTWRTKGTPHISQTTYTAVIHQLKAKHILALFVFRHSPICCRPTAIANLSKHLTQHLFSLPWMRHDSSVFLEIDTAVQTFNFEKFIPATIQVNNQMNASVQKGSTRTGKCTVILIFSKSGPIS